MKIKKAVSRQITTADGVPTSDAAKHAIIKSLTEAREQVETQGVVYFKSLEAICQSQAKAIPINLLPEYVTLVIGVGVWFSSRMMSRKEVLGYTEEQIGSMIEELLGAEDRTVGDTDIVATNPVPLPNVDFRGALPDGWSNVQRLDTPEGNKAFRELMESATCIAEQALEPIIVHDH
jgi:hypothetical protein